MFFESRIFPTIAEMSEAALAEILRILNNAVSKLGRFSIALAGGHTPAKLYALWAEKYKTQTPWDRVHLFFGDERFVPEEDLLSNYRMARQTLIDHVPIPKENVHPMLTNFPSMEKAAEAYEVELRRFFGEGAALDVQFSASASRDIQPRSSRAHQRSMNRGAGFWLSPRLPSRRSGSL